MSILLGSRRRRLVAAGVAALAVLVLGSLAWRANRQPGWTTVWSDGFTGAAGTAPSDRNWVAATGTSYPGGPAQWGTGEVETYTADAANVALDGQGHLRITATRDAAGVWRSARP